MSACPSAMACRSIVSAACFSSAAFAAVASFGPATPAHQADSIPHRRSSGGHSGPAHAESSDVATTAIGRARLPVPWYWLELGRAPARRDAGGEQEDDEEATMRHDE